MTPRVGVWENRKDVIRAVGGIKTPCNKAVGRIERTI